MPTTSPRPVALLFGLTMAVSAALLFAVQPMAGKMILPLLGGTPAVWNTTMMVFQILLLAGYAYAFATSRFLPLKAQLPLHIALLGLCALVLPLALPAGTQPPSDSGYVLWQVCTMLATFGPPFFILAATAPLLQRWYAHLGQTDSKDPYFLYAASNAGSLLGLLAYPFLIEPLLGISRQSEVWTVGYGVFALALLLTAARLIARRETPAPEATAQETDSATAHPSATQRLYWVLLTLAPSSLLLGVTTFISTNIAALPLLWVIPFALYLLTFIIAFSRKPVISRKMSQFLMMLALAWCLVFSIFWPNSTPAIALGLHLILFFTTALACHHELVALRPASPRYLTEFYLLISLGGALGGMVNALLAPVLFTEPLEYPAALVLALLLRYASDPKTSPRAAFSEWRATIRKSGFELSNAVLVLIAVLAFAVLATQVHNVNFVALSCIVIGTGLVFNYDRRYTSAIVSIILMVMFSGSSFHISPETNGYTARSYFGIHHVYTDGNTRFLVHGDTTHGLQTLDPRLEMIPGSYYHPSGGAGGIFGALDKAPAGPQSVAAIGLGTGSIACYTRPGRHFTFFEIDPAIIRTARDSGQFTYLSKCGSPYDIVTGDARLTIAKAPDHSFDLIFLDAFGSDSIPLHLMTREAFALYDSKLKPDGMIAVHVSNRFFDLRPEVALQAKALGWDSVSMTAPGDLKGESGVISYPTRYVLMSRNADLLNALRQFGWEQPDGEGDAAPWTDDYANPLRALILKRLLALKDR